jgi:L-rhamnose mutarotase
LHTVVDVWELPDANAVQTTLQAVSQDPAFQKWASAIKECVEDETLQVMTKLPV